MIHTWSHSRLAVYEQCPLRARLQYIDKIPEPERPLPPGKSEHANDRGTRVHTAGELYVTSNVSLVHELKPFTPEFDNLRTRYGACKDHVQCEQEWGFNRNWVPVSWSSSDIWARIKLDYFVRLDKTSGVVIDLKTGKRFGNEIKHAQQGQLYQLAAFLRDPQLQTVTVEFWYSDQDELHGQIYRRDQGMRFLKGIEKRAVHMTTTKVFPPKPSLSACRWCPYGLRGTGHCTVGKY